MNRHEILETRIAAVSEIEDPRVRKLVRSARRFIRDLQNEIADLEEVVEGAPFEIPDFDYSKEDAVEMLDRFLDLSNWSRDGCYFIWNPLFLKASGTDPIPEIQEIRRILE